MRLRSMSKFHFDTEAAVIILPVLLSGKGRSRQKIRMALDTGATYTMIPWKTAEILGLAPEISKDRIDIITASGMEKSPLLKLDSMMVLGKKIENVKVVVHDLPSKSCVDGLLGLNSLCELKLKIDFDSGVIEI